MPIFPLGGITHELVNVPAWPVNVGLMELQPHGFGGADAYSFDKAWLMSGSRFNLDCGTLPVCRKMLSALRADRDADTPSTMRGARQQWFSRYPGFSRAAYRPEQALSP